jgi:hypothetical protein
MRSDTGPFAGARAKPIIHSRNMYATGISLLHPMSPVKDNSPSLASYNSQFDLSKWTGLIPVISLCGTFQSSRARYIEYTNQDLPLIAIHSLSCLAMPFCFNFVCVFARTRRPTGTYGPLDFVRGSVSVTVHGRR